MRKTKPNRQKDILFILVSSFIVVAAWVGFNIYHIWATSTVAPDVQEQLLPIGPNFDPATLQQLKTKENINPLFENQGTASQSASPTVPTDTPSPAPTDAGTSTASDASRLAPTNTPINIQGQ